MVRVGLFVGCLCALSGCGSSDSNASPATTSSAGATSTAGSSGASGSAGVSGSAGATMCNSLVNSAPAVQETFSNDSAATATGGTITDGTYYETAFLNYNANSSTTPAQPTHKLTATISGTTFQAVYLDDTSTEQRITLTLRLTGGTMLEEDITCTTSSPNQMGVVATNGYDATPTTVQLHLLQSPTNNAYPVYTLTKQ